MGPDLLKVTGLDGTGLLYPFLARRLAESLGVGGDNLGEGRELQDISSRYLDQSADNPVHRIYTALRRIVSETDTMPIPEPLLQLASIAPLQLFITTTFDSGLARALNQVRGNKTRSLAYSPDQVDDLPAQPIQASSPIAYHLLGKCSVTPSYAVTQWDLVEYFHTLQSETRRPHHLFDELNRRSLLLLGCGLDGWLMRFFLRMAKGQISVGGQSPIYIADNRVNNDPSVLSYLHHVNYNTEVFAGSPIGFIEELNRRWTTRPSSQEVRSSMAEDRPAPVFLSYSDVDETAAEKLKKSLEDVGIDVHRGAHPSEVSGAWESNLARRLKCCSLFIPVVSQQAMVPGGYLQQEWTVAAAETEKFEGRVMPVVVDETQPEAGGIPEQFRSVRWHSLPGGVVNEEFVSLAQQLYRRYQKSVAMGTR